MLASSYDHYGCNLAIFSCSHGSSLTNSGYTSPRDNNHRLVFSHLLGLGETDSVPAEVVDRVVLSEEGVTDDPEGADRGGDVHAREARDARSTGVQDVVLSLERVVLSAKLERQLRQAGDGVAIDGVLAVPRLGRTDPVINTGANRLGSSRLTPC